MASEIEYDDKRQSIDLEDFDLNVQSKKKKTCQSGVKVADLPEVQGESRCHRNRASLLAKIDVPVQPQTDDFQRALERLDEQLLAASTKPKKWESKLLAMTSTTRKTIGNEEEEERKDVQLNIEEEGENSAMETTIKESESHNSHRENFLVNVTHIIQRDDTDFDKPSIEVTIKRKTDRSPGKEYAMRNKQDQSTASFVLPPIKNVTYYSESLSKKRTTGKVTKFPYLKKTVKNHLAVANSKCKKADFLWHTFLVGNNIMMPLEVIYYLNVSASLNPTNGILNPTYFSFNSILANFVSSEVFNDAKQPNKLVPYRYHNIFHRKTELK